MKSAPQDQDDDTSVSENEVAQAEPAKKKRSTGRKDKSSEPRVFFRLTITAGVAMGPGKASLLKAIDRTGSIAAAARDMEMAYSRAWLLVRSMNDQFKKPLVEVGRGGNTRGGARVTEEGFAALALYETMQGLAESAISPHTKEFSSLLK
jgi:molybdate transport system regulatory protein